MTAMALEDTTWKEDAADVIDVLAKSGTSFDVNDFRKEMREAPHPNMIGSAFRRAKAIGVIKEWDTSRAKHRAAHGRRIVRWIGAEYAVAEF